LKLRIPWADLPFLAGVVEKKPENGRYLTGTVQTKEQSSAIIFFVNRHLFTRRKKYYD
jgi:hypothetical protein